VVTLISFGSIALWTASPWLSIVGKNIGIVSLFPLIMFFGLRLLTKEDFEHMPWPLVMLICGGNVLGYAVQGSRLLEIASSLLLSLPSNLWIISTVSSLLMLAAGSFISHTVAALVLLQLFAKIGEALLHPRLLVMVAVAVCGGSVPLPISSLPNMNIFSVEDSEGVSYLSTLDIIKVGLPSTIIGFVCANSITYGISLFFGL